MSAPHAMASQGPGRVLMPATPQRQVVLLRSALYRSRTHRHHLGQSRPHILDHAAKGRLLPMCYDMLRPVVLLHRALYHSRTHHHHRGWAVVGVVGLQRRYVEVVWGLVGVHQGGEVPGGG
jgi:hypothetical protein